MTQKLESREELFKRTIYKGGGQLQRAELHGPAGARGRRSS